MIILFYIWGIINAVLILLTIRTINPKLITNNKGIDKEKVEVINRKNFLKFNLIVIWVLLGLFIHSMMIYFVFYFLLIYLLRFVHRKYNWVIYPTKFNININKIIRFLHFILILVPVINYFYFKFNITIWFYSLL